MRRSMPLLCLLLVLLFVGVSTAQVATPASTHVVVVALENHQYSAIVGSPYMPYLNSLIAKGGLTTNYYANAGGSFPDYMMLTVGNEIATYAWWNGTVTQDNIVRALLAKGKTWKSYAESIPSVGYTGGTVYPYVKYHNPMAYFSDVINSPAQTANLVGLGQLSTDVAAGQLPNFTYIVPNLEHDAHDCPGGASATCSDSTKLATADQWMQTNIDPILHSPQFQQDGLLIVWWDEGAGGTQQVATVFYGPKVAPGSKTGTYYQHQSTLRTMAEALQLGDYPGAAATAPAISGIWATGSVTITSPTNGATVNSPIHVTASANGAGNAITGMTVYLDGTAVYTNSSSSVDTSITAAAGSHTIQVTAADSQGTTYSKSVSVTVSAPAACTPPAAGLTLVAPTDGSTVPAPVHVVACAGGGGYNITAMYIYLDYNAVYKVYNTNQLDTYINTTAGAHYVRVQAWNSQGAVYVAPAHITVSASTATGSVTISSPANGSTVASPIHVTASASGGSYPISSMSVLLDGTAVYQTSASTVDTMVNAAAGSHTVQVKAVDSQGTTYSSSATVTVSSSTTCTPPAAGITVVTPVANSTVSSPVQVIACAGGGGYNISSIWVYVDYTAVYKVYNTSQVNTSLNLAVGKHYIRLQAWNSQGTVYVAPLYVTVQ